MSDCKEAVRLPSIINMEIEANKLHSVQVNKHSQRNRNRFCVVSEGSLGIELRIRAGILEHSVGARNRVGIGFSHRPAAPEPVFLNV
jgi:hypothetical protein